MYLGKFDIGHAGVPLIVLYTSVPALILFIIIYLISPLSISHDGAENIKLKRYYISIYINITINLITSFTLIKL